MNELMTNMMNSLIKRAQDLKQNAKEVSVAFLNDQEDEEHLYQAIEDYANENPVPDEVFLAFENQDPTQAAHLFLSSIGDQDILYSDDVHHIPSASSQFEQDKQSAISAALRVFKNKDLKLSLKIIFQFLNDYNVFPNLNKLKSLPPQDLALVVIDSITDLNEPLTSYSLDSIDEDDPEEDTFEEDIKSIPVSHPEIEGDPEELPSFEDFSLSQETTKLNPELIEELRKSMEETKH